MRLEVCVSVGPHSPQHASQAHVGTSDASVKTFFWHIVFRQPLAEALPVFPVNGSILTEPEHPEIVFKDTFTIPEV